MGNGTAVEVIDVSKRFGTVIALDRVKLSAQRGAVTGVLGRNGAGKSTIVSLVVGLIRPDQGDVRVLGIRPPYPADLRRRIGFAPQRLALYDKLTVRENLTVFGAVHGLQGRELDQRIDAVVGDLDLRPFAGRRLDRCSGGVQRRVNMAVALLPDVDLVLLDEPTASVDVQSREAILATARTLARAGKSVIYTTHYIEEAESICDEVVILHNGRALASAPPAELVARNGTSLVSFIDAGTGARTESAVADPVEFLERVLRDGIRVRDLRVAPPRLEEVFLKMTGQELPHA
jgi:ABC-2 type transport system ATP-binding protein